MLKTPPALNGYTVSPREAKSARDCGKLLSMRLETSAACNLRCIYCNGETGRILSGELTLSEMKDAILQVKDLGGRSVVVIGGGEPTVYPLFKKLICFINVRKMVPVVITNGLRLTGDLCRFLYEENASVLFKLDALDEKIQDRLSGCKGTHKRIMRGIEHLFKAGFNKSETGKLRCGASFVVTALNYGEVEKVWRFCRENNLYPNLEELIPRSRAYMQTDRLWVNKEKLFALKKKLLALDRRKYGYDWLVHFPLPAHGCLQMFYSVYIACQGYVRPCADVDVRFFNVREMKIADVLKTPFFQLVRNIEKNLDGKCGKCRYGDMCHGCRGMAFTVGMNEGLNPFQAICREDPVCCRS